MQALRGEVWEARIPSIGLHTALVLSVNALNDVLGHVTVAVVTGSAGPSVTHVPLGRDAGLTKYPESYVNVTDLHAVARGALRRRRGLCSPEELGHIEELVRLYLGL